MFKTKKATLVGIALVRIMSTTVVPEVRLSNFKMVHMVNGRPCHVLLISIGLKQTIIKYSVATTMNGHLRRTFYREQ